MTSYDYARYRLSIFTKEEAQAIVGYLRYKRDADPHNINKGAIDGALNLYWLDRAANAPVSDSLKHHVEEEANFIAEMNPNVE
jgi:hypothetical protein